MSATPGVMKTPRYVIDSRQRFRGRAGIKHARAYPHVRP